MIFFEKMHSYDAAIDNKSSDILSHSDLDKENDFYDHTKANDSASNSMTNSPKTDKADKQTTFSTKFHPRGSILSPMFKREDSFSKLQTSLLKRCFEMVH